MNVSRIIVHYKTLNNISCNEVCNIGIISISKVLQVNGTLQILDISHNNINDDGVIAIGEALKIYDEDNSMATTSKGVTIIQHCMLQNLTCHTITYPVRV